MTGTERSTLQRYSSTSSVQSAASGYPSSAASSRNNSGASVSSSSGVSSAASGVASPSLSPSWTGGLMSFLFRTAQPQAPTAAQSPHAHAKGEGKDLSMDAQPMLLSSPPPTVAVSQPQPVPGANAGLYAPQPTHSPSHSNSPSLSGQMPVFHSTSSSRNPSVSLSGSSSFAGALPKVHSDEVEASSQSSTGSSAAASRPASGSTQQLNIPPSYGYGVLGTLQGSSGSLHPIYQTNVVMTPSSSLPSTPVAGHSVPAAISLDAMSGVGPHKSPSGSPHAPKQLTYTVPVGSPTAAVTYVPAGSPTATTAAVAQYPQQAVVQQQAPQQAAVPVRSPSQSPTRSPQDVPSLNRPSDEVLMTRSMFRSLPHLARSLFTLGDTLGTGTFGRVCIVSFVPPSSSAPRYFALKMLKKSEIIRLKQVEHIKAEKAILSRIAHPFIVNLYSHFQDERHLYMCMEFVVGGELFSQLRKVGRFSNDTARFYAAEIILALQYLHAQHIVYRDLKPENLLIDREGHIKITGEWNDCGALSGALPLREFALLTYSPSHLSVFPAPDFGFAKVVEDRTWTLCGTPEYLVSWSSTVEQSKIEADVLRHSSLTQLTSALFPPFLSL